MNYEIKIDAGECIVIISSNSQFDSDINILKSFDVFSVIGKACNIMG